MIEVGAGFQIDSVFVTTSNASGPTNYSVSFSMRDPSNNVPASDYFLPLGSTTPNLALTAIGPSEYSLSMFGQLADAEGPFALDYTIQLNVSAVPVPAAVWLFGSGLLGLFGMARRKKA